MKTAREVDTVITSDDVQLYKVGSGAIDHHRRRHRKHFRQPRRGMDSPHPATSSLASSKIVLAEGAGLVGWPVEGLRPRVDLRRRQ